VLRPSSVVNAAAWIPGPTRRGDDWEPLFRVNAIGAGNVARWAAARGARRLLHCSTLAVVGRPWPVPLAEDAPTRPRGAAAGYGASKVAGEILVEAIAEGAGLSVLVARLSALYGPRMPWQGAVPAFVDAALDGRRPRVDGGRAVHVDLL
jgi:nucleoside-diphosphate-sugar epimerase